MTLMPSYNYLSMPPPLPMRGCNYHHESLYYMYSTDSGATELKDYASRPRSQKVAIEAVELRDEEGDALKVVWALGKVEP